MSIMPYVKFYSESFLTGVSGLTNEECGMYIRLLCLQHQTGHLDERTICLACAIKSVSEIPYVMKKFEQDEDGLYFNERMEKEITKAEEYSESRLRNGKLGGRPKKTDSEEPCGSNSENHMDNHTKTICEQKENHMGTYRALEISSSILDSSNTELRVDRVESNIPIDSYLEQGEEHINTVLDKTPKESKEEQKKTKIKKEKNNFDEPDRVQDFIPFVDEFQFSDKLREAVVNWFDFKLECGFAYKTRPLKTLLAQIKEKAEEVGDKPMISRINTAVSSSWKGINIETMDGFSGNVPKYQNKAGRFEQIDFDKIEV